MMVMIWWIKKISVEEGRVVLCSLGVFFLTDLNSLTSSTSEPGPADQGERNHDRVK